MNVVIYTAIVGPIDSIINPPVNQDIPMVCFTDQPYISPCWETIDIRDVYLPDGLSAVQQSRYFKLLPHIHFPNYEYTIWVDGCDILRGRLIDLIPFEEDWVSFRHPTRSCLYKELDAIRRYRKDSKSATEQARTRYKRLGVPPNVGMAACSVIWRKNTPSMNQFNEAWWDEFLANGTCRDQPAWAYCNWKSPLNARLLSGDHMNNQYTKRVPHHRVN